MPLNRTTGDRDGEFDKQAEARHALAGAEAMEPNIEQRRTGRLRRFGKRALDEGNIRQAGAAVQVGDQVAPFVRRCRARPHNNVSWAWPRCRIAASAAAVPWSRDASNRGGPREAGWARNRHEAVPVD